MATYFITNTNILTMIWKAQLLDTEEGFSTPINMCNHAYWNLSGDFKERTIENHKLMVDAENVLEFTDV